MKRIIKNKGFTIVELIVVMAIIAILILIAVPAFTKYINEANETSEMGDANTIFKAALSAVAKDCVSDTHSTVVVGEEISDDQPIIKDIKDAINGKLTFKIYGYSVSNAPVKGQDNSTAWEVYIPATPKSIPDDKGEIIIIAPNTDTIYVDGIDPSFK